MRKRKNSWKGQAKVNQLTLLPPNLPESLILGVTVLSLAGSDVKGRYLLHVALDELRGGDLLRRQTLLQLQPHRLAPLWPADTHIETTLDTQSCRLWTPPHPHPTHTHIGGLCRGFAFVCCCPEEGETPW